MKTLSTFTLTILLGLLVMLFMVGNLVSASASAVNHAPAVTSINHPAAFTSTLYLPIILKP